MHGQELTKEERAQADQLWSEYDRQVRSSDAHQIGTREALETFFYKLGQSK